MEYFLFLTIAKVPSVFVILLIQAASLTQCGSILAHDIDRCTTASVPFYTRWIHMREVIRFSILVVYEHKDVLLTPGGRWPINLMDPIRLIGPISLIATY